MIRILAALSIIVSGFFATTVEKFNQGLCVFEYIGKNKVTYIRDLMSSSSGDVDMMIVSGSVLIFFGMILYFIKNKIIFIILFAIALFFELIFLNMIDTLPYKTVLYDSVFQCGNWSVLGWFVMQLIAMALTVVYLARNSYEEW